MKRVKTMKLTKKDILIVREIVVDGKIIEEIPHIRAIRIDKLLVVVVELEARLKHIIEYYELTPEIIDYTTGDLFGEILEG